MIYAIIPARGGSKGVVGKNLRLVGGLPLLAHTIIDALEFTDNVYVSTEDKAIKEVAVLYGAKVIDRPDELAQDISSADIAVEHALLSVGANDNDIVVFMQCTSPFRSSNEIRKAIGAFLSNRNTSMYSCYALYPFVWTQNGYRHEYGITNRPNRQDKEPVYVEDGSFYISYVKSYYENHCRLTGGATAWVHHRMYGLEIDDDYDLEIANTIYGFYRSKGWI